MEAVKRFGKTFNNESAINVLFQEIDFSKFDICQNDERIRYMEFHGIRIRYLKDYPTFFSIKNLWTVFKRKGHPKISNFFENGNTGLLLKQLNYTRENTTIKIATKSTTLCDGEEFMTSKLLWLMLFWINRLTFIELMCKVFGGFDFYSDEIPIQIIRDNGLGSTDIKWMNLDSFIDNNDKFISLSDLRRSLDLMYEFEIKRTQKHDRDNGKVSERLEFFQLNSKFGLSAYKDIRNLRKPNNTFIQSNVAIIYLDSYRSIYFWDMFLNFYKKKELVDNMEKSILYTIDMNNSMIESLNDNFGNAKYDDMIVKFHKQTSYIHAKTTASVLDPIKAEHMSRWLIQKDTIEYMTALENEIRKEVGLEIDKLWRKPKMASIENMEIPIRDVILKQLQDHPSYFIISIEYGVEFQGYYLHPELFQFEIMWLSKTKAVQYIKMLTIICQRIGIQNSSTETEIKHQVYQLKNEIDEMKEVIRQRNEKINELEIRNKGSVSISITSDGDVKARSKCYNEPEKSDRIVYNNIENPSIVKKELNQLIKQEDMHDLSIPEIRPITDRKIKIVLKDMIETNEEFVWNEEEYKKRKAEFEKNDNFKTRGYLYESICSKVLKAYLIKDLPLWFKNKFGIDGSDGGIDLFDLKNKILYQCKNYVKLRMSDSLRRTFESVSSKIISIDNSYIVKLVTPKSCIITSDVCGKFGADNIIRINMEDLDMVLPDLSISHNKEIPKGLSVPIKANYIERQHGFVNLCKRLLNAIKYDKINDKDEDYIISENRIYRCKAFKRLQISNALKEVSKRFETLMIDGFECFIVIPSDCVVTKEVRSAFNIIRIDEENESIL